MGFKKAGLLSLFLFISVLTSAQKRTLVQDLESDEPGCGQVHIEMDQRIDSLLGSYKVNPDEESFKAIGYRIQVYMGNNTRQSKDQATQTDKYIRENFPDLPVYTVFRSPRWLCLVGDFLYYEEAYETMRRLKKESQFKQMIILRNQEIRVPL